jgi:Zn finger protein HypA/HybF involved in hydrogenase expression
MKTEKTTKLKKVKCPTCKLTLLIKASVKFCPACRGPLPAWQKV